ncbi:MAG: Aspartate racemase [Burkholderiaceae bacterium]|jgi:aspartate racemase|nr:MAG: Aspartate racemase [Burkholderiaceae bacterium]
MADLTPSRPPPAAPLCIGIVACSSEGAALCYRTICAEAVQAMGPHAHPEVLLHGHSLAAYVDCLDASDLAGVAALMQDSAHRLARAGAEFLICPDNTVHQAMHLVVPQSPLPWLHIADTVAAAAKARGHARVGVMGTRWLVASEVYAQSLGRFDIACVRPGAADVAETDRIIMDELVAGDIRPASTERLCAVTERLRAQGCDAVVLGCTELPLALSDRNSALTTLDSPRLLARAAIAHALNGDRRGGVAGRTPARP